ncbi:MAG TPA: hypothetical protein VFW53_04935, partial [Gallionella sp.]|nr:hypothetical protein [Gallionella sp.]
LSVSCTMTYASLFSEPNTLLKWRKLELLWQKQDKRGWLENLPLWPTTLALALLFALPLPLTSNETQTVFIRTDFLLPHHALAFALMMLRDACILLFFSFAPNSKRATSTAMLYLFAIDMLLPFLAEVAGLDTLRYFLLPFDPGYSPVSGILIMTVHAAIAITLVNWRLRSGTAMNAPR